MICGSGFVIAYNRLFDYLYDKYPIEELYYFWEMLSDAVTGDLRALAKEQGVAGLTAYWTKTLSAEKADFRIIADIAGEKESFELFIRECPSLKKLNEKNQKICPHYCKHCDTLYRKALEPLGFQYEVQFLPETGNCRILIQREKSKSSPKSDAITKAP